MQREERVFTNACVNYIVPLVILGLIANFIPHLMVIVPVDEEDVCWFYFLTRSPYQLSFVDNNLYWMAYISRLIIVTGEILFLAYQVWKISKGRMNLG